MIPVRGYQGQKVAVLGLGRSGRAAVAALETGGAEVLAWDDQPEARADLDCTDLTRPGAFDGVSVLVLSPGIPHLYPAPHPIVCAAQEAGAVIDNDIGLFFRSFATPAWEKFERSPRVVCVTGSNGKSTTTALIAHLLKSAGHKVQMGGNIGRGVLDLDPARDGEVIVLELSSYQLELARALAPDIAVFLNFSPDHLDRHGGIGGYFAAKARLFREGGPERAIIARDSIEGQFLAQQMREMDTGMPVISLSDAKRPEGWAITARKGFIAEWRSGRQVASLDLRGLPGLPGAHNLRNAAAAFASLRALGLGPRQIEAGFASFEALPHRCKQVAVVEGVTYVNDSKATNADAAEHALRAFERIRWIVGGVPKAGGIAALAPLLDRVAKAYLIGEAADAFAAQLGTHPHEICGSLDVAFARARTEAAPGETVLLSPAAASFDQFASFEARGAAFEALVQGL